MWTDRVAWQSGFPAPSSCATGSGQSKHKTIVLGTMAPVTGDCVGRHFSLFSGCGIPPTTSASYQSRVLLQPCPHDLPHCTLSPLQEAGDTKAEKVTQNIDCIILHRRLLIAQAFCPIFPASSAEASFQKHSIQSHSSAKPATASAVPRA